MCHLIDISHFFKFHILRSLLPDTKLIQKTDTKKVIAAVSLHRLNHCVSACKYVVFDFRKAAILTWINLQHGLHNVTDDQII